MFARLCYLKKKIRCGLSGNIESDSCAKRGRELYRPNPTSLARQVAFLCATALPICDDFVV